MATAEELFTPHKADALLIVKFYHDAKENKFKSHEAGRPVFDDIEMCEINFPADRAKSLFVPAHSEWKRFGTTRVTYAERFKEHYARFKLNEGPVVEGTPLSEAPFLSMAQKASLKALQVYTIEQLASLTGQALKNIGAGGLAIQQQAEAYLSTASGTADAVKMRIEIEELKRQLAERPIPEPVTDGYDDMDTEALKSHIETKTGSRPRGNPSDATLRMMARELDKEAAA
jgi:hypothetical protein